MTKRIETPLADKVAFSPEEATQVTSIGLDTIRAAIRSGRLRAHAIGRRHIVRRADLEAWLETLPRVNEEAT
jgi:excisionase family DNA binding protein